MNRQTLFIEEFNALPNWQTRYQYLCDLGTELLPMPEKLKIPVNRLKGCQSVLYFHVSLSPAVHIQAWGSSAVSLGLAALMATLFNGLSPEQLRQTPITFHTATGLIHNLSLTRSVGLLEMIAKLQLQL
jgi:cysteine desulfuration protein SufE